MRNFQCLIFTLKRSCICYYLICVTVPLSSYIRWKPELFGASKIRNFGNCFFVHLITCLRTRSCTSHFVPLKQSFVHACTLTCTSPCTYYKDKVNVRSIPLTINPEPSLGIQTLFYRERNNRQVSCLSRTKQPDNFPLTMFESN